MASSATPSATTTALSLPPGPLGINIRASPSGTCVVVSKKPNPANPLAVHDEIVSLNGIALADVEVGEGAVGGKVGAWVKLFAAFGGGERRCVVVRGGRAKGNAGSASGGAASTASASTSANVAATAKPPAPKPEPMEVICLDDSDDDKNSATAATLAATAAAKPAAAKPTGYVAGKKKAALKDSTWHNAKKRKADGSATKKAAKKPQGKAAAGKKQSTGAKSVAKGKGNKSKKDDFVHDDNYMRLLAEGFNNYGSVSPCENYYITLNNDTYRTIADKVGVEDWKALNGVEFNARFYGQLGGNVQLKKGTIVKIPRELCSKWKMGKLVDHHVEEVKEMATCAKCLQKEQPGDADEILLCDGCDVEIHVSCAGLAAVPATDFLCDACLAVLSARKTHQAAACPKDAEGRRSLEARLPALPPLDTATLQLAEDAATRFTTEMTARKDAALRRLEENQRVLAKELRDRLSTLSGEYNAQKLVVAREKANHNDAKNRIFHSYSIRGWSLQSYGKSYIKYRREDDSTGVVYRETTYRYGYGSTTKSCPAWNSWHRKVQACSRALDALPEKAVEEAATERLNSLAEDLNQATEEEKERPAIDEQDKRELQLEFAMLLSEPKLDFETKYAYQSRAECKPVLLGVVNVESDMDVRVLNILREPTELVLSIPVSSSAVANVEAVESEYYLFGTSEFFSSKRNDDTPMDFSPTSTRTAQRDLMGMLLRDTRNKALLVSKPQIPSSVVLRGTADETLGDVVKKFDLSELVRDCHYPIQNQPMAETPKRLADNGLVLRDYQKSSLQWLLDKESNPTGLGSSGELWSRMRGLNGNGQDFYYCELTGSIVKDIFDYSTDVDQKDASKRCGDTFPSAAIIGSEMGLGKTVIALSLVVASPPTLQNRVLPREHIAPINHPAYAPPPSVVKSTSSTSKTAFLSNGTLVIAPMTLCPQWQAEIQRFAPWMSFITLHNDETDSVEEIASKDIVVVSTFLMSSPGGKQGAILNKLKRIHFHRIFLDEAHMNNTGHRSQVSLAQLSSTHRYAVTGTPVGRSLADLYGQLRFLRVPEFCRKEFFDNNINKPYSEHNCYALNVLRSLLSRMVIRHSKEQTLNNGDALVNLPPRNVETLLLPFGSDAEKKIYEHLDLRNTQRFMELRSDSPATVLGEYMELMGMLHSSRVACAHPSLVSLDNLHGFNERLERWRLRRHEKLHGKTEKKSTKKPSKSTTREDIFQEAISKARVSAKGRMREAVLEFQDGAVELLECPVCLDATGEEDIALTPCAHKFCSECILACMDSTSRSREPNGICPECRDKFVKSELTFLGDAEDAGKKAATLPDEDDRKPEAKRGEEVDINGFHLSMKDSVATANGASDRRVVQSLLSDSEKRQQRAHCHTLPPEFLTACNTGYNSIGTKIACLLEELKTMIQKDATAKAVVFSQFLGTLDVAGQEMVARGIKYTRVDGMMKQHQRADAIMSFTDDPNTRVLLLSMRAGAAGLNLMAANHCFLMDPALNSAVEEQAIDRIHRIGQTRPVFVKRLIIKDSVEERILENRRSLAADRPTASTQLDGAGMLSEDGQIMKQAEKRGRHEDENDMGEQKFQRLQQLEALFGCSATVKVTKA